MKHKAAEPLLRRFPQFTTPESARIYLEDRRWRGHVICPYCTFGSRISSRTGKRVGYFRCGDCGQEFTVRTGTILERSHVPLNKWLHSMYLLITAPNGISSTQLSKELGVTQKTAWSILARLRQVCRHN